MIKTKLLAMQDKFKPLDPKVDVKSNRSYTIIDKFISILGIQMY